MSASAFTQTETRERSIPAVPAGVAQAAHEAAAQRDDLHGRAKRGIRLLLGRQVLLQLVTFGGGVILARALSPAQFGLYAIATFLVSMFSLLGDCGLGPSLIQRKDELTERDLQTAFTLQQIVATAVVAVLWVTAPWLARLYPKAPPETVWLVRALAFGLYLTSWRSTSALRLERHMQYGRIARVEVAETLIYQGAAVTLAVMGFGIWSLACATLARGLVGTALIYAASPWPIRLRFDRPVVAELLRFGIPFQSQFIISHLTTWISPLMVGPLIGPAGVGFLGWAAGNGIKPLILVDNVVRVAFPHFARLQDDRAERQRILIRYFTWLLVPAGFWFALLLAAGRPLVTWIYTPKWEPAVVSLVLYSGYTCCHVIVWLAGTALNGIGLVRENTRIVIVRTTGQILLAAGLIFLIGFNGVPAAALIVDALLLPWTLVKIDRGLPRLALRSLAWVAVPMGAACAAGLVVSLAPFSVAARAALATISVTAVYAGAVWLAGPRWIRDFVIARLRRRFA